MNQDRMTILGIETSCDETAAAVAVGRRTTDHRRRTAPTVDSGLWSVDLLSNIIASQVDLHAATGGVVPEVAARAHVEAILPVIQQALAVSPLEVRSNGKTNFLTSEGLQPERSNQARRWRDDLTRIFDAIDAIAVTTGPGLIGSLLIGLETAKTLGYVFQKPIIPVNHLEGHIYANFVGRELEVSPFPALVLIVSGGHTELVLMKDHLQYELIGQTRDDAAGECFDKTARLLGLPYPGGPALSKLAEPGDPKAYHWPRPMLHSKNFDFSFSGLKTAVYYTLKELAVSPLEVRSNGKTNFLTSEGLQPERSNQARRWRDDLTSAKRADLAASIQQAIVDVLVSKTIAAAKQYQAKTVMISGGVAANHLLRQTMGKSVAQQLPSISYRQPNLDLATDNAGMIAIAGIYRFLNGDAENWYDVGIDANASLA